MLMLLTVAFAAVCSDNTMDELEQTITDVLDANNNVDEIAFARSSKLMDAALTCLDEAPPPSTLARIHHTMALRAFINGQTRAAKRSLASLRMIDPRWTSPFPRGHPFTELWINATDPGPVQAIGSIGPKAWVIDSVERNEVPLERGFVLQVHNEDGGIQLTRYLWDPSDMPNFGQNRELDLAATPWLVSIRGMGIGRAFGQLQRVDGSAALEDQGASSLGVGGEAVLRVTPSATIGAEVVLAVVASDDLVGSTNAALGVESHAVMLLGGGIGAVGSGTAFLAGRVGLVTDTIRAWPRAGQGVEPTSWRLWGPSVGAEVGVRGRKSQVDLAIDGALAGLTSPWRADGRVGLTQLVTENLGLRAQMLGRTAAQPLQDGDAGVGRTAENELRLSLGIDLVF